MVIKAFPPLHSADESGLLAVGGDLQIESLLLAYRNGIFPWPLNNEFLAWFSPPKRALLFFDKLHLSRRLQRRLRNAAFDYSINKCFRQVIENCATAKNRSGQKGTWITPDIIEAYVELHLAGHAHSVEVWQNGRLVGGIYGVAIGRMFAGESMFHQVSDASKAALCFLIEELQRYNVSWLDCQVMTPLLHDFGAVEIDRREFTDLLNVETEIPIKIFAAHA